MDELLKAIWDEPEWMLFYVAVLFFATSPAWLLVIYLFMHT